MSAERRRSPRIELPERLQGRSKAHDLPIRVRDFSLGGMAIETGFAFTVGDVHTFNVTLGDGSIVELHGRVLRCRNLGGSDEPPLFVSGIQFVEDAESQTQATDVIGKIKKG